MGNTKHTLKVRVQKPNVAVTNLNDEIDIPQESIISRSKNFSKPELLICMTMYNETMMQFIQSAAGIYRSYYELIDYKNEYFGKVGLVVVIDGYDRLFDKEGKPNDLLKGLEKCNLYNPAYTTDYVSAEINSSDHTKYVKKFAGTS